jgi:hypothetical protein
MFDEKNDNYIPKVTSIGNFFLQPLPSFLPSPVMPEGHLQVTLPSVLIQCALQGLDSGILHSSISTEPQTRYVIRYERKNLLYITAHTPKN